jgi:hypothetical protein
MILDKSLSQRDLDKLLGRDDYYNKLVEDERKCLVQQETDREFYEWDNYGDS